jgi:hypothetical protein
MMINVLVSAQYYENYSDTDTPYWKPKGGMDFSFPASSETLLYIRQDVLEKTLIKMVEEQSNSHYRYEYLSHEIKFYQPKVVEGLEKELDRMVMA